MTAAAAAPRTTGNMAAGFLCSKLEMASCGPDTFLYSSGKQVRGETGHLYHYEVMPHLCACLSVASHDKHLMNQLMVSHQH